MHITHHMDEIVDCDRVIVMKDGSKVLKIRQKNCLSRTFRNINSLFR